MSQVLFAGAIKPIATALVIMKAGSNGALADVLAFVSGPAGRPNDAAYFWVTGSLSSFPESHLSDEPRLGAADQNADPPVYR
jgi:hypothetical protein